MTRFPRRAEVEPPLPPDDSRLIDLDRRLRDVEAKINQASGVLNFIRWIAPPFLTLGAGVVIFLLGRSSGG